MGKPKLYGRRTVSNTSVIATNDEVNRGDERIAGESTGAFAAPVRSQSPAVRAVSGAEIDAILVGEKVDWRCYLRYGEKTPRLTVFG